MRVSLYDKEIRGSRKDSTSDRPTPACRGNAAHAAAAANIGPRIKLLEGNMITLTEEEDG